MPTKLLTRNGKLKKASHYTVNFGIPAMKTCPMASICKSYCYASKGAYAWPAVKNAYEYRFKKTKRDDFDLIMLETLFNMPQVECIRIHDSGDFYNNRYLQKWINVANALPDRIFYFYTKSVTRIKDYQAMGLIPSNMIAIYSLGGKEDRHIDLDTDRHSKIFKTKKELIQAGYVDASYDDSIAWKSNNHKIGLVIH